jgi:hypothetical protein
MVSPEAFALKTQISMPLELKKFMLGSKALISNVNQGQLHPVCNWGMSLKKTRKLYLKTLKIHLG